MSTVSLLIASSLMAIPIISYKEKLDLGKEMITSVIRAVVQLLIVGYILNAIFGFNNPISGMIISNSMVAIVLGYRNLNNSFKSRQAEIETKLSLGASIKQTSADIVRESIKIAILPTIDSAKMLGIVSLPGMMTGLILGGTSPIMAVKFQIMVTFMIMSSSAISILLSTYLSYKSFFNQRFQLI